MGKSPESSSPCTWHSLVLEPLQAKHVGKIREQLDLSLSTDRQVNNMADAHIVEQTAGVPRQIWRVLTAAKVLNVQLKSIEDAKARLTQLCRVLAEHPLLQSELVDLKRHGLITEYTHMHVVSVTGALIKYPLCSRYLPLTLTEKGEKDGHKLYQVNTAPIFTHGLTKDIMKESENMSSLRGVNWILSPTRANEYERVVLRRLCRAIVMHEIAKREAGPEGTTPPFSLYQLLPFLCKSDLPDQELPDVPLDQMARELKKSARDSNRFDGLLKGMLTLKSIWHQMSHQ